MTSSKSIPSCHPKPSFNWTWHKQPPWEIYPSSSVLSKSCQPWQSRWRKPSHTLAFFRQSEDASHPNSAKVCFGSPFVWNDLQQAWFRILGLIRLSACHIWCSSHHHRALLEQFRIVRVSVLHFLFGNSSTFSLPWSVGSMLGWPNQAWFFRCQGYIRIEHEESSRIGPSDFPVFDG